MECLHARGVAPSPLSPHAASSARPPHRARERGCGHTTHLPLLVRLSTRTLDEACLQKWRTATAVRTLRVEAPIGPRKPEREYPVILFPDDQPKRRATVRRSREGHFWRWRESWRWARARLLGLGGNCITTITGVLRRLRRLRSSWAASFRSWPLLASDSDSRTRALAGRRSGLRLRLLLLRLLFLEAGCRTPFASRRLRL
jgi:hypothetical protein